MEQQQVQESSGKQLRLEFWQAMWFPLTVYLISGYSMEAGYTLFGCFQLFCVFAWNNFENNDTFNKWTTGLSYGAVAIVVSAFGRSWINQVCFRGEEKVVEEWLIQAGPIAGWEELMLSAAIVLRIAFFFLLSRTVEKTQKKSLAIDTAFWLLLAATLFGVHYAMTSGNEPKHIRDQTFETLVNSFTAASLTALCLCAPVLYLGLSARRTTVFVCVLAVLFVPIVFLTKLAVVYRIRMQSAYPSTGSYTAVATHFTRFYRPCVGVSLALVFAVEQLWNRRQE